ATGSSGPRLSVAHRQPAASFVLRPRPPPATPFPYTTLFRSRLHSRETAATMDERPTGNARAVSFRHAPIVRMTNTYIGNGTARADRKSTRLNSSHEWISYAVFCLKKKIDKSKRQAHGRTHSS